MYEPVLLIKLFIILLFLFILVFLFLGLVFGRLHILERRDRVYMEAHRAYMRVATFSTIAGVLAIEVFIRIAGAKEATGLFWVHLMFAIPFLVSLLTLAFWKTGLRSPGFHRKLGYACLLSFVGVLTTGGVLLFNY